MITGATIQAAREALGWSQSRLATKARVPLKTVVRAESSPGEPVITITQRNSLLNALRAGGANTLRWRAGASDPEPQGTRGSPTRQGSLTIRDRYQLRLLALHDRFYGPSTGLQTLEQRGFITPTGRTDEAGRTEWSITEAGRTALRAVES